MKTVTTDWPDDLYSELNNPALECEGHCNYNRRWQSTLTRGHPIVEIFPRMRFDLRQTTVLLIHTSKHHTMRPTNEGQCTASLHNNTAQCSEIGSLMSLEAQISGASSDLREPISLHQAVQHTCTMRFNR